MKHPLTIWREKQGISQATFGKQLGKVMKRKPIAQKTIFEWEAGKTLPRVDVALIIEKLTNYNVCADVWGRYSHKQKK